jgi:diguanylate cyclase (GGDEF)-like protein/PAS domain S-box-containing protein
MGLSSLWVSSGIVTGVLLTTSRQRWWGVAGGAWAGFVTVNLWRNGLTWSTGILSSANLLEAWLVAVAVGRAVTDVSDLSRINRSVRVAALATVGATLLTGTLAALSRLGPGSPGFWPLLQTWVASHATGMAIFATLTVAARVEGLGVVGSVGRRLELALTLVLVGAVSWLVFSQNRYGVAFLTIPPLLLCVFRHRFSGFVTGTALLAVIATSRTAAGYGPFMLPGDVGDVQRTWMLQLFIATVCFLAFPVATVLTERRVLARRLAKSETQYRLLADNSRDLVVQLAADGTRRYVSPSATELLGWAREELSGPRWDLVHPEDVEALKQALAQLFREGGTRTVSFRTQHRDGHYIWIEANATRVSGSNPESPFEVIYSGRDVTRRMEAEAALERLARHDALTDLANRHAFQERFAQALARTRRQGMPFALLYLDLDRFKAINDSSGHGAGDVVLIQFAQRLRGCLRATDFAARLGGDEFVVIVEDLSAGQIPKPVLEKILEQARVPVAIDGALVRVSASIGVALATADDAGLDVVLARADRALYAAKAAGKDTWRTAEA